MSHPSTRSSNGDHGVAVPPFELNRQVPCVADVDVLVLGGGPAGIGTAVAAGREGAKVALVEQYGYLGGMATAGLVGPFMTSFSADGKEQVVLGVFEELVQRMVEIGGALHPKDIPAGSSHSGFFVEGHHNVTPFDPEALKLVSFEMVEEAGVELFLHSFFVAPVMDGNGINGAVIVNKSGLQYLRAKVVIDCTGDADVAAAAGVPFEVGRKEDGKMQPMTMFFRIRNVDSETVHAYVAANPEDEGFQSFIEKARKNGDFPIETGLVGVYETHRPGEWRVNTSRIHDLDGTNVRDLTRGEIVGRRQALAIVKFLREYVPGFENVEMIDTAAQIGVRETRHIKGEYLLTADDLLHSKPFDDAIAQYAYPIDIHDPSGRGHVLHSVKTGNIYEIPYRVMIPVDVENLIVAGRSVSATHEAAAAIRVMPCAFAIGQAAGVAAALCAKEGVTPRQVNVTEVQKRLDRQGAKLPTHVLDRIR